MPVEPNPLLAAALEYARRGWRVVPLAAKDKRPWVKDWVNAASADPGVVGGWWAERPASNVGVALGSASGLAAVDVDTEGGAARLLAMAGDDFPATCEMTTGKGSRLLYRVPDGLGFEPLQVVLKGAAGEEELRLQGKGGQCVMPPSVHPNGKAYAWVEGRSPADLEPAPMPGWLVGAMRPKEGGAAESEVRTSAPPSPPPQYAPGEGAVYDAGGHFNRDGDWWRDVLEPAGFKRDSEGPGGSVRYTRPNKDRGVSVTLGFCKAKDGTDALYVFTGSIPELPGQHSYDKFGAYTRLQHQGNFRMAAQALAAKGYGTPRPAAKAAAAPGQPPPQQKPEEGYTAADLVKKQFPPVKYALDGLLTEGLSILGGRPKKGKSWLALQLGWAVAGGYEIDGRKTTQGEVLYLALEDTPRRLQTRLLTMLGGRPGWEVPAGLHLRTRWPRAADGGLQALGEWLSDRKGSARLVIIDTLAKFRTPPRNQASGYAEDYEAVGGIKALADTYGSSILLVHHTRKMKADDPFDELSGTLGLTGAADGTWVLDRGGDMTAELFVTGRDVAEATVAMTFDGAHCVWRLGEMTEGVRTGERTASPSAVKLGECRQWLKEFLAVYAHPSAEIEAAAKAKGYGWTVLRDAKAALGRQGTGELVSKNFKAGGKNNWWCGLGDVEKWTFRPGPDIPPGYGSAKNTARPGTERGMPDEPEEPPEPDGEVF